MLVSSLYKVTMFEHAGGVIHAGLILNKESEIFKGHFPNQPILPGACILQMLKEILGKGTGINTRLQKGDNLKFLSLVDPQQNEELQLAISYIQDDLSIKVTASLTAGEVVCFKFQGVFVKE